MNSLVNQLATDYPLYSFAPSDVFAWNPAKKTVYYEATGSAARLFHELGHAELSHETYRRDVELLRMEADAWKTAEEIATRYDSTIGEDEVEMHMDSYREWLHARSTCPKCDTSGVQTSADGYHCLECAAEWRVNEARRCGLKRYVEHKNTPR